MLNLDRVRKIKKGEYGLTIPQLQYNYSTGSLEQGQNWKERLNNQFFLDSQNQPNPHMNGNSAAQFLKSPQGLNLMSSGVDILNNTLFSNKDSYDTKYGGWTQAGDQLTNQVTNIVSSINPALGLALKGANFLGNTLGKLGGSTDGMTKADAILNTGMGNFLTLGLNGFFGKRTRDFAVDNQTRERAGNSYTGSYNDIDEAASLANKKYGLVSGKARRKAEGKINYADSIQNTITGITDNAYERQLITSNMSQLNSLRYNTNQNGGIDQRYLVSAKQGDKIQRIKKLQLHRVGGIINQSINVDTKQIEEWSPTITECFEEIVEWTPTIEMMKEGGKTEELESPKIEETNQKNIIPEGALHARKHNMENAENLTKKGIPVIDNEGEQQAEIEKNEIIFTLEVTKKLEELMKDGSDEAAIEAGKLLVKEILFNTEDRTGLIGTLGKGGVIDVVS